MRYLDICSGISAPTMAWKPLGWEAACFAEIEAAPRAVLAHHYPDVPLHGDFTEIKGTEHGPVDLLVGGTPCQSFSVVAGLRGGLADDRGNLALEYLRLADRARPRWLVWENVPGVLSSNNGRDFGAILGGMGELGYGFAYRVLDAQHFGVPQRRRRVFVVGYLGDWRPPAAVFFERTSLSGNTAPRREKGQTAPTIPSRNSAGGGLGTDFDLDGGLIAHTQFGDVAGALTARHDSSPCADRGMNVICFSAKDHGADVGEIAPTLRAGGHSGSHANAGVMPAVAFQSSQSGFREVETNATLDANNGSRRHNGVMLGNMVRRLTPRECERLQGFPDDFTLVPYRNRMMADGPRYKMLGNSMAVPVVRWIGERIARVEALSLQKAAA